MKRVVRLGMIMAVLMMGVLIGGEKSQAQTGIIKLKKNKVYSQYDVTADGKADKVKVTSKTKKKNDMNTMTIVINGKKVFKHKDYYGDPDVQLAQLEDGHALFSVFHRGMDDYGLRALYSYTDAKWKKVMSLNATKEEDKYDGPQGGVTAVSGNAVTIEYTAQSAMVGISKYSMDYEYTDGKMELLTPIADYYILKLQEKDADFVLHETMKARIEMDVYDKVEEGRTVAFNIKAEDDVKFLQIQRINGRPWYFVQVGENTGWLQCGPFRYYEYQEGDSDYEGSSGYFHNAAYAG